MAKRSSLLAYTLSRLLLALPMLFILLTAVSVVLRILPGDPITALYGRRPPLRHRHLRDSDILAGPHVPARLRGATPLASDESAVLADSANPCNGPPHDRFDPRGELAELRRCDPPSGPPVPYPRSVSE